jgi:alkylhydroperoxidase family enzyme
VASAGIPADVRQGLTDKLDPALQALARGQTGAACNQLAAFQNQVQAQRAKAIPAATADAWLTRAAQIRQSLGC